MVSPVTNLDSCFYEFDTKSKQILKQLKLYQTKTIFTGKEINKMKREKIFANHISDEQLTSKIYK